MADRRLYWGMLTPREVRRLSLWAFAGVVVRLGAAPMLKAHWFLAGALAEFAGIMMILCPLVWINVGAPG